MELDSKQFLDFDLDFPGFGSLESSALECYLKILEDQIGFAQGQFKIVEERRLRLEYEENKLSDEEYGQSLFVVDDIADEHFSRLFRNGAIVSIWSYFESSCTDLAVYAMNMENKEERLRDMKAGNFRANLKRYFEQVLGIVLPWSTNEYQSLEELQQLRNFLAHRNGRLMDLPAEEEKKKTNQFSKINGVKVVSSNIVVQASFVSESAKLVFNTVNELKKVLAIKYGQPVGLY